MKKNDGTYYKQRNEGENRGVSSVLGVNPDRPFHHGVLTHEDNGIAPQTLPNVLELSGSDVVSRHHQHLRVLIQQPAHLLVVVHLLLRLGQFWSHGAAVNSTFSTVVCGVEVKVKNPSFYRSLYR